MPRLEIRPTADLKQIAKELRQVADGKQLRKELTGGIRDALRPVVRQAKAARGGGPLRARLARVIRLEVRTSGKLAGARIRMDGRKMPDGMKSLPGYVEGEKTRWRHPVFGDRETWVAQAAFPVFYRTVEPHRDEVSRAIDGVLEDVKAKLEARR